MRNCRPLKSESINQHLCVTTNNALLRCVTLGLVLRRWGSAVPDESTGRRSELHFLRQSQSWSSIHTGEYCFMAGQPQHFKLPAAIEIHKVKWAGESDKYINSSNTPHFIPQHNSVWRHRARRYTQRYDFQSLTPAVLIVDLLAPVTANRTICCITLLQITSSWGKLGKQNDLIQKAKDVVKPLNYVCKLCLPTLMRFLGFPFSSYVTLRPSHHTFPHPET